MLEQYGQINVPATRADGEQFLHAYVGNLEGKKL